MNPRNIVSSRYSSWRARCLVLGVPGTESVSRAMKDVIAFHEVGGRGELSASQFAYKAQGFRHTRGKSQMVPVGYPQGYDSLCDILANAFDDSATPCTQDADDALAEVICGTEPVFQESGLVCMPIEIIGHIMNLLPDEDLRSTRTLCGSIHSAYEHLHRKASTVPIYVDLAADVTLEVFCFAFEEGRRIHFGPLLPLYAEAVPFWLSARRKLPPLHTAQLHELAYRAGQVQQQTSWKHQVAHIRLQNRLPAPCFSSALFGHVLAPVVVGFPRLQRLTLIGMNVSKSALLALSAIALDCLTLEECTVFDTRVLPAGAKPTVRARQLVLKWDGEHFIHWVGMWNILAASSGMQTLIVSALAGSVPLDLSPRIADDVQLPELEVLVLIGVDGWSLPRFIAWLGLRAPNVRRFYLKARSSLDGDQPHIDALSVIDLLAPWGQTLTTLAFDRVNYMADDISARLADALPALRSFSYYHDAPLESVLACLRTLPKLITFRCNIIAAGQNDALHYMRQFRNACSSLRKFALGGVFERDNFRGYAASCTDDIEGILVDGKVHDADIWEDLTWSCVSCP
ncbi:hypothetical protein AURDEDRAFT_131175 [Auricularia subglabra TFB-10046 SS5]|uniref:F-box domain-containing protein n=1 Tax=Auricularia subglabra (strain TFB-10046 / SS5) TaxID=717982 RepID=J0LD20_AURST|nr:hypothetical protein AURDEDRAFT_131175 [Auricularia subglabra TFB-10046 SS5]